MKSFHVNFWIRLSLLSLLLVALLGFLMRYKISFEFPLLLQKNVQHAHSHFAFAGWVTQTLMVLLIYILQRSTESFNLQKYKYVLASNLALAYAMLISFTLQGYGLFSITFSTLSLLVSFWYSWIFWKDLVQLKGKTLAVPWFKASLAFLVLSSLGTFSLAYMMATKYVPQDWYLSSVYFYLHFQFNGWFWFALFGLWMADIPMTLQNEKINRNAFNLFLYSCIPAFLLSVLWLKIPIWVYGIILLAALAQLWGWYLMFKNFGKYALENLEPFYRFLLKCVALCITIKLLLQLLSLVPELGKLAFGFRSIVLAYLHLVLLAIITTSILVYIRKLNILYYRKHFSLFFALFALGIFLNEIVLTTQGIAAVFYTIIPNINELLFGISILLLLGISGMFFSSKKTN